MDSLRRLLLILIILIPATTPFSLYYIYERPQVAQRFFLQLSIILAVQLAILISLAFNLALRWRLKKIDWFVLGYGLVIVFSSILKGSEPIFNLKESIFPLSLILYFLLLRWFAPSVNETRKILLLLLFVGLINATYGFAQYFGFELLSYIGEQKVGKLNVLAFAGHPNFLAAFLVPIIYLTFIFFISDTNITSRVFSVLVACAITVCLILSGARGAWLGTIISSIFFFVNLHFLPFMKPYRRYAYVLFATILFLVMCIVALLIIPNPLVKKKYSLLERLTARTEVTSRFYAWCIARDMFLKNPLLGIGYGGFTAKYWDYVVEFHQKPENKVYSDMNIRLSGVAPGQVHNELLEIAAETGLLGVIMFLLILIETFRRGFSLIYHPPSTSGSSSNHLSNTGTLEEITALSLLSAILFMLIDSLFNFTFQLPMSGILFWLLLALFHNLSHTVTKTQPA